MSINYSANTLIGVKLERKNDRDHILGTSIAIPVEDDEPIEITIDSPDGKARHLKAYDGGEVNGRHYFGYLIDTDEESLWSPRGVSIADVNAAIDAVKLGLKGLGYEGEVELFCFLACY
jgi:hypothetical protein